MSSLLVPPYSEWRRRVGHRHTRPATTPPVCMASATVAVRRPLLDEAPDLPRLHVQPPQRSHSSPSSTNPTRRKLQKTVSALRETASSLKDQIDWFKRQLFGRRSEKPGVRPVGAGEPVISAPATFRRPVPTEDISYGRRCWKDRGNAVNGSGLRFDDSVPVTTIEVKVPAVEGDAG